jgi:predicted nucleic acid-binding protein
VADRIILDTGPLGRIAHPRANPEATRWLKTRLAEGAEVFIPEIADYEVRRELLRAGMTRSLNRLDALKELLFYVPLDTTTILRAAELWAKIRNMGKPTADPKELDGDVILAAQAERVGAIIATENVGHLSLLVQAKGWQDL